MASEYKVEYLCGNECVYNSQNIISLSGKVKEHDGKLINAEIILFSITTLFTVCSRHN